MGTILDAQGNPTNPTDAAPKLGIELADRDNVHIDNNQCRDKLSLFHLKEIASKEARYSATKRTNANPLYNCHGLSFACRRAEIYDVAAIKRILVADRYEEVSRTEALPGDTIIYYGDDGDVEHSGLVIEKANPPIQPPMIVSKWGKGPEYIHSANQCPYDFSQAKFYRVKS
jgi:hypothetical protein